MTLRDTVPVLMQLKGQPGRQTTQNRAMRGTCQSSGILNGTSLEGRGLSWGAMEAAGDSPAWGRAAKGWGLDRKRARVGRTLSRWGIGL